MLGAPAVACSGGSLYFGLLIGMPRACFNAHRIYSTNQILEYFAGLKLVKFSFVNYKGRLMQNVEPDIARDTQYGCGLFQFKK